jgi:hypothetical protein
MPAITARRNEEREMTTIQIAYDVDAAAVARVEALLAEVAKRDVNWNGADFRIERDDFTCIPDNESPDAVILLGQINRAIAGEA